MKTVIEMAREAGLHRQQHNLISSPVQHRFSYDGYEENLERFAELVRADEREAVLDLVDDYAKGNFDLRDAIRARGNT